MAVSQARLNRYRADIDAYGDAAATYIEEYLSALIAENPGAPISEIRDEAIAAIDDSLNAFGDQASTLALDLLEEIAGSYGVPVETAIEDVIPSEMADGGVRYAARRLVEGDSPTFIRDVADLSRYYIHRSAFENMERNCARNDLRYARVPSGRETCGFCFMLSSRGFVYRSEQTAGSTHAYHDHCDCVIVPGFKDLPVSEQVEGYDPDAMLERWHECQDTVGTDAELRERWKSMTDKQRARYKGRSDGERYRRFANAQAIREAETRDFRWLNTGEVPRYSAERGAHPDRFESRCGEILRENGFTVQFRKTAGSQHGGYKKRTSDTYIGGASWEMKNPESDNDKTVKNQMKKAVGKDSGRAQSDRLVISNVRSDRTVEQMVLDVEKLFSSGRFTEIREVLIVGKDGQIRRVTR